MHIKNGGFHKKCINHGILVSDSSRKKRSPPDILIAQQVSNRANPSIYGICRKLQEDLEVQLFNKTKDTESTNLIIDSWKMIMIPIYTLNSYFMVRCIPQTLA